MNISHQNIMIELTTLTLPLLLARKLFMVLDKLSSKFYCKIDYNLKQRCCD